MPWKQVAPDMPHHDVLLWVEGRCVIGCMVEGVRRGKVWRVFMDPRTDDLLPWPSYWMPLPGSPRLSRKPETRALRSSD